MRKSLEDGGGRGQVSQVTTLPIPHRGWNTRDRFSAIHDANALAYAPVLSNWMVVNGRLIIRPGFSEWATGLPAASIGTLMNYGASSGTATLFAAVGTEIYNVTASGAVGAAAVSALTNDDFQHVMFSTTSGQYLVCVNGADGVRTYSGAAWASQVLTGVTAANLIGVTAHHGRLWFIEKETLNAYYLATLAIAGAATKFPVGAICKRGGSLMAIGSWSGDAGSGPDDRLVMVTTEGEVLVYEGINPNSTTSWRLVGIYQADKPVGRRCLAKFGSELVILTESGIVRVSRLFGSDPESRDPISDPIREEFINRVESARTDPGWEVFNYSRRGWLMVNIPLATTGQFQQFVFNPLQQAWFMFEDIASYCWAQSGNEIFFGGSGKTYKWDDGTTDDNGEAVVADFGGAWSNYGTGQLKKFNLMRPNFFTDGTVTPLVAMRVDYDESFPTAEAEPSEAPDGAVWDVEDWDVASWGGTMAPYARWLTVSGVGITAAPRLKVSTLTATVALTSIDLAFQTGGIV